MTNINNFKEIGVDQLIKHIESDSKIYKNENELLNYYISHVFIELEECSMLIKENQNNTETLQNSFNLCSSLEVLINKNNLSFNKVLEDGHLVKHPLVKAYLINKKEKNIFVSEIVENINSWNNSGKNILNEIKLFRMSPEGRQSIVRKKVSFDINNLLNELLNNFSVSQRGEIFTRIEKYIESGWFEKDSPLKEYFNGKIKTEDAIKSLENAMGKRFFNASIESEQIAGVYFKYNLILNEEDILGGRVFNISLGGFKDYCIKSVDGKKLYIGDVTTQESGYNNGNSWIKTAKAILNYKKNNNELEIDYSVSLLSLFYDVEFSSLKTKFIEKFNESSKINIDDWHLLQYLAVLDRDYMDHQVDFQEIFNITTLNFFGTNSEKECNKVLKLNNGDFIKSIFQTFNRVLNNINYEYSINAQGMETNVESTPIHLLVASLKGFEKVVNNNKELTNQYCEFSEKVKKLSKIIVGQGHIKEEAKRLSDRMKYPDDITNAYLEDLNEYNSIKNKIEELKKQEQEFKEKNQELLEETQYAIYYLFDVFIDNSYSILNAQSDTWRENYDEVVYNIEQGLSKIFNEYDKEKIVYNKQTLNKKDNPIKEVIMSFVESIDNSKDGLDLSKNIVNSIEKIKEVFNRAKKDGFEIGDYLFKTKNKKNTQGNLTMYGKFIEAIKSSGYNEKQFYKMFKEKVFKQIDLLEDNLIELKENAEILNSNKNKIIQPNFI